MGLVLSVRWIVFAAQAIIIFPALKLGWLQTHTRLPAILMISLVLAINAASLFAQRYKLIRPTQGYLLSQLGFDLFALTGLLWLTGGAWNPLIVLLFLQAAMAALLLQGLHLIGFLMLLFWSSTALYSNPIVPPPAQGLSMPSVLLYPAHMTVLLGLVGLIAWVAHKLEIKRREIETAKDEISKLEHLRVFGVFVAGFSHEFATPLSTLHMRLKRLQRLNPELLNNDDLLEAFEAAKRCDLTLKNLLQRRNNLTECTFEKIDVGEKVREVAEIWRQSNAPLVVSVPTMPLEVRSPVEPLRQVISDLLENARQANPNGKIILSAEGHSQKGHVEIKIEDDGAGVPDIVRKHLGEPFLTTREDGHGLGLFHAVTFARALGGFLRIDDRPEGGTRIILQLPLVETRYT